MKKTLILISIIYFLSCDKLQLAEFSYDINLQRDTNLINIYWIHKVKNDTINLIRHRNDGGLEYYYYDSSLHFFSSQDDNLTNLGVRKVYWSTESNVITYYDRVSFSNRPIIYKEKYKLNSQKDTLFLETIPEGHKHYFVKK